MTYEVVLEQPAQGSYTATVLGWTDCSAEGASRQEALRRIRDLFTARLAWRKSKSYLWKSNRLKTNILG